VDTRELMRNFLVDRINVLFTEDVRFDDPGSTQAAIEALALGLTAVYTAHHGILLSVDLGESLTNEILDGLDRWKTSWQARQ
jgi:hypothetical protein